MSAAARAMRTAISPRFAIRSFVTLMTSPASTATRQERGQQPEEQEKGAQLVHGGDAGEIRELAERGCAQASQAERETVEHPRRQPHPTRQQLLGIDED